MGHSIYVVIGWTPGSGDVTSHNAFVMSMRSNDTFGFLLVIIYMQLRSTRI